MRRLLATFAVAATAVCANVSAANATSAYIYHFDISTAVQTYTNTGACGGPCTYLVPFTTAGQWYQWAVDMAHSNVVSENACSDYSNYRSISFPAHYPIGANAAFLNKFSYNNCLVFRARSEYDTQYNRNGYFQYDG
jgi:hypothetical protein